MPDTSSPQNAENAKVKQICGARKERVFAALLRDARMQMLSAETTGSENVINSSKRGEEEEVGEKKMGIFREGQYLRLCGAENLL